MNSFNHKIFNNQVGHMDTSDNSSGEENTYWDFMRELEARERDLHIRADLPVIETAKSAAEEKEIEELEKVLELYEDRGSINNQNYIQQFTEEFEVETETQENHSGEETAKYETERIELLDAYRRKHLDFENLKNRTERERDEVQQRILAHLVNRFLPVLDNLERAVNCVNVYGENNAESFNDFIKGVSLVKQQFSEVLTEMGVSAILAVGEVFDPNLHEAVDVETNREVTPNTITEEILRGYQTKDAIIRHSQVKVSRWD